MPFAGIGLVTTLMVNTLGDRPATFVLRLKAGAIERVVAERATDVEAVNESLGLVPIVDMQAFAACWC